MGDTGYPGSEQGRPDPSDQIQFGTSPRRPWLARLVIAAIGIAAITVAVVHSAAGAHRHHPPSAQRHHPTSAQPSIAFTDTGHPILGEAAGWELFARGDTFVADIELGRGRVTRTAVPWLTSGTAASFVAGAHEVIVRSYDSVPGYVIPDGKPAQVLTGPLATGGPLVAGPTLARQTSRSRITTRRRDANGAEGPPADSSGRDAERGVRQAAWTHAG